MPDDCSCEFVDIGHGLTMRVYSPGCAAHGPDDEAEVTKDPASYHTSLTDWESHDG